MEFGLKGRHVAILAADGVDAAQLEGAREALAGAGAVVDLLAASSGSVHAGDGHTVSVDRTFDLCHASDYDALVIPGGRGGIDALRGSDQAVQFVREFMAADKPVAAIAHGIQLLVAADAVAGREVAAARDVAADVRDRGGSVIDAPVHVDEKLITSRGGEPAALASVMLREFSNRVDEARVDQLSEQSFPASDPPPGPTAVGGQGASETLHLDPRGAGSDGAAGEPTAQRQ